METKDIQKRWRKYFQSLSLKASELEKKSQLLSICECVCVCVLCLCMKASILGEVHILMKLVALRKTLAMTY